MHIREGPRDLPSSSATSRHGSGPSFCNRSPRSRPGNNSSAMNGVVGLISPDVEHLDQVGAPEVGEDAALVEEALPCILTGVGQHLHRRGASEDPVLARVDHRGPAAPIGATTSKRSPRTSPTDTRDHSFAVTGPPGPSGGAWRVARGGGHGRIRRRFSQRSQAGRRIRGQHDDWFARVIVVVSVVTVLHIDVRALVGDQHRSDDDRTKYRGSRDQYHRCGIPSTRVRDQCGLRSKARRLRGWRSKMPRCGGLCGLGRHLPRLDQHHNILPDG
jgi:hypothetical protein